MYYYNSHNLNITRYNYVHQKITVANALPSI